MPKMVQVGNVKVIPALATEATREIFTMRPPVAKRDEVAAIVAAEEKRRRKAAKRKP